MVNQQEDSKRPTDVATLPATSGTLQTVASTDSDLVSRAKAGDPDALATIAEQELPRVERLLGRILGRRHDMEDLVQNVFLELCRALPTFRGESRLSTFVGGITVRVARRALRPSAWARRRGPMPADVEAEAKKGPEREAIVASQLERVHRALDGIKPKKRIAFALYVFEGLSPAQIAEVTGAKEHTVRSRIFHARRELLEAARRDPVLAELMEER
jgi:RNA polymerase sigma-70 factor (ECF subfamily)